MRKALTAALLLLAAPALAAPPPTPPAQRLDVLLARGAALAAAGDATCAVSLEAAALAAERSDDDYARAIGALGLCREVGGRFGEAHRLVSRALEGAPAETTAAGKRAPWPALRAALRRLDDRVARVLVTFDGDLFVDGRSAVATSGAVLAVDPGKRLFEARQKGQTIAAREVEVRAGDLPKVNLRVETAPKIHRDPGSPLVPGISTAPVAPPSPFAPALSPRGVAVTVAYAGLGGAVVSGIVAGVLEAQRAALASRLSPSACVDRTAPGCAELRLAFEQRTGARNVALIAGGIGLAASGAAIVLHFTADKAPLVGLTWSGRW